MKPFKSSCLTFQLTRQSPDHNMFPKSSRAVLCTKLHERQAASSSSMLASKREKATSLHTRSRKNDKPTLGSRNVNKN